MPNPGPDPSVASKADITILRSGGHLWVLDGDDAPGDFVHIKKGKFIRWHNRTGARCRLTFRTLPEVDEPGSGVESWPFEPHQASGVKDLSPGEVWKAKLKDIDPPAQVKYDVELPDWPQVGKLDPVIIIKP